MFKSLYEYYLPLSMLSWIPAVCGLLCTIPLQRFRTSNTARKLTGGLFFALNFLLIGYSKSSTEKALITAVAIVALYGYFARAPLRSPFASKWQSSLCFAIFIFFWIVAKYIIPLRLQYDEYWWSPIWGRDIKFFGLAGISYIGFKLLHFYKDLKDEAIEGYSIPNFLCWLFFFPSLVAGPMQRFQDWQRQTRNRKVTLDDVSEGLHRILVGLFMKIAIANTIRQWSIAEIDYTGLTQDSWGVILLSAMIYTIYLYFDFAGYSSIAIGIGRFWGVRLPENFNRPYLSRNLIEFWNRWHITLSELLRDYFFYPISLAIKRRAFFKARPRLALILPPLLTFLFAGLWHGLTFGFLIFGLMHGLGIAGLSLMGAKSGISRKKGRQPHWADRVKLLPSVLFNFCYVSVTFIFFCLSNEQIGELAMRISKAFSS